MSVAADKTLEALFAFRLEQLKADSEHASSSASQVARVTAYGLTALIIPYLSSKPNDIPRMVKDHYLLILLASMLGCFAIVSDLIQNVLADRCARQELVRLADNLEEKKLEVSGPEEFMASSSPSWSRSAREQFYWLKMCFVVLGVAVVVWTILAEMIAN